MNQARFQKLAIRWSLLATIGIALFWGIWYAVAGSVPEAHIPPILWVLKNPLHVSRWFDLAAGVCLATPLAMLVTLEPLPEDPDWRATWYFAPVLILWVISGILFILHLVANLGYGTSGSANAKDDEYLAAISLISPLAIGLATALRPDMTLQKRFRAGLKISWLAGTISFFGTGLAGAIMSTSSYLIGFCVFILLVSPFASPRVRNWIMGRDTD